MTMNGPQKTTVCAIVWSQTQQQQSWRRIFK